VAACRSSPNIAIKMNFQPSLNKNSPHAHMNLGFEVLGVAGNLEKYIVHLSKRIKE
jgi:hypothetical protein